MNSTQPIYAFAYASHSKQYAPNGRVAELSSASIAGLPLSNYLCFLGRAKRNYEILSCVSGWAEGR
jgi:hypothetical protein